MGADFVIHYSCRPKETLGAGDVLQGTVRLLELLKLRGIASHIEAVAQAEGKAAAEMSFSRQRRNAVTGAETEESISYPDLITQTAPLDELARDCQACPANCLADAFGCAGFARYPIPARAEEWLMDMLEPADTAGGFYLLKALGDLGYTGEAMRTWREGGLFERPEPVERALDPDRPAETRVTSDQVWHALFGVGWELRPWHCSMLLLWCGAILLDGEGVTETAQVQALLDLDPAERLARTQPDLGPPDGDPDIFGLQRLLFAGYVSWLHDVPLLLDA